MDSKSILLSCLFVLFWFAASAAATGDKVTLQVEFKSDNEIVYVCDPDGGTNTERCEFYLDNKTTDIMSSKDGNTLRLNVTLTTETEAVVTCRCNFSSGRTIISDQVAVASECYKILYLVKSCSGRYHAFLYFIPFSLRIAFQLYS